MLSLPLPPPPGSEALHLPVHHPALSSGGPWGVVNVQADNGDAAHSPCSDVFLPQPFSRWTDKWTASDAMGVAGE
jgi:hypothetical protein